MDIVFTDDVTISKLAGRYRSSPYATDVLAFDYRGGRGGFSFPDDLAGEIVISLDTAGRQASKRNVPIEKELILLCVHGLLHLEGIDDETKQGWRLMRISEFETLMRIL